MRSSIASRHASKAGAAAGGAGFHDVAEYHSDPYADRRRDAVLSALGYRVLRFMYSQVLYEWRSVEAAILAAMSRGDHLAA
ncbi:MULTISPECIES: DUF559 domain-containing protein [unclassified Cryobacterium]|uniref:DUF559 domain-containing protein n=1 Tax=Cryobacterium sp. BB307 TaxID=2716317 RepID=UPI001D0BE946|nr:MULTISPECIES: DUF559 domain-containing protein [unclassified Cryobacterium]